MVVAKALPEPAGAQTAPAATAIVEIEL